MADNVAITAGSGTTIAADDISGVLHQRVKVSVGADGSATDMTAGAGAVAAGTPRVTLASDDPAVASLAVLDNIVSGSEAQVDVVAALPAGTNLLGKVSIDQVTANANEVVIKSITAGNTNIGDVDVASIAAGDNNIGNVDVASIAAGTNNIGDVDVLTVPADPFGANADAAATAGSTGSIQAKLRLITSQIDSVKTAVETIDNVVSGSEAQVDIVGALPAGTNAIGKLAANSGVDIGDVDVTSIAAGDNNIGNVDVVTLPATPAGTNAIGKLLPPDVDVTTHTNYIKKYYTSTGAVTDGIIWSPAAGKRWHVVSMYIQTSLAATITVEDDKAAGDDPVLKGEFAANSGVMQYYGEKYPLASAEDAADLLITTSAGNVYVTITGYEI